MPGVQHMRHTHLPEHKFVKGQPDTGVEMAEDLERIAMNFGGENIAACIIEPIAGSTGTLVPPKGYLKRIREICDKHGILLIFDEVITGWGRTGSAFASQEFGVTPDMITMAKATTRGCRHSRRQTRHLAARAAAVVATQRAMSSCGLRVRKSPMRSSWVCSSNTATALSRCAWRRVRSIRSLTPVRARAVPSCHSPRCSTRRSLRCRLRSLLSVLVKSPRA